MGYGDIGPFGNTVNQTPNLDTRQPYTPLPVVRQNEPVAHVSDGADQSLLCEFVPKLRQLMGLEDFEATGRIEPKPQKSRFTSRGGKPSTPPSKGVPVS